MSKSKDRVDRERKMKRDRDERRRKFLRDEKERVRQYNDYMSDMFDEAEIYKTTLK